MSIIFNLFKNVNVTGKPILKKIILVLNIGLYFLSIISFLYFIIYGIKIKALKCILLFCILLAIRFLQGLSNIKLHDLLKITVLIFIFMAIFLADILEFYAKIPIFDKILHTISGSMLFFVGHAIYRKIEPSHKGTSLMLLFSMFFSIAMAGCWEIFEFSADRLFGYHLQRDSLFDTMGDIICGTTMAVITCLVSFFAIKASEKEKNNYSDKIIDLEYPELIIEEISTNSNAS